MEFLFILHYLSFLSVSIKQCEKITKESVNQGVALSTYYVTKQPLAHIVMYLPLILTGAVFCMYYITSLTSEYLPIYNLDK